MTARTPLEKAFQDLKRDLVDEDGPRISTMRNHHFAILQYDPAEEFKVRRGVQRLTSELTAHGWEVIPLDLHRLFMDRVRAQGKRWTERVIAGEKSQSEVSREQGLNYLVGKLRPLIEGPDGIAADCSRIIQERVAARPDRAERTLAIIGRAGSLYPFFRSSALLRHLSGRTDKIPVVLLYPGERRGPTGLSFMGVIQPDNDYRPRIYP